MLHHLRLCCRPSVRSSSVCAFSKDFGMRLTASTIFLVHPFVTRYSTKAGFDATGELSSQTSAAHLTAELPPLTSPSAEDTNETNWHKNVVVCATGEAEDNAKQWPSQSCGQQQHCSRRTSVGKACVLEGYIGGPTLWWSATIFVSVSRAQKSI